MGRHASHQPRLAWDYRRAILLVQVLAADGDYFVRRAALRELARAWGLDEQGGQALMVSRLAKHALRKRRKS